MKVNNFNNQIPTSGTTRASSGSTGPSGLQQQLQKARTTGVAKFPEYVTSTGPQALHQKAKLGSQHDPLGDLTDNNMDSAERLLGKSRNHLAILGKGIEELRSNLPKRPDFDSLMNKTLGGSDAIRSRNFYSDRRDSDSPTLPAKYADSISSKTSTVSALLKDFPAPPTNSTSSLMSQPVEEFPTGYSTPEPGSQPGTPESSRFSEDSKTRPEGDAHSLSSEASTVSVRDFPALPTDRPHPLRSHPVNTSSVWPDTATPSGRGDSPTLSPNAAPTGILASNQPARLQGSLGGSLTSGQSSPGTINTGSESPTLSQAAKDGRELSGREHGNFTTVEALPTAPKKSSKGEKLGAWVKSHTTRPVSGERLRKPPPEDMSNQSRLHRLGLRSSEHPKVQEKLDQFTERLGGGFRGLLERFKRSQ